MRPGAWTHEGFLLPGDSLVEVIAADEAALRRRGMRAHHLGTRLLAALAAAEGSDFLRPRKLGGLAVEIHRKRGLITCPWAPEENSACTHGEGGMATANRFVLKNRRAKARVEGFALTAHMIAEHGFFGGPGTPFRIEPDRLVDALGAAPPAAG